MSNYQPLATASTRNPPLRHLSIGVWPGLNVNCGICDRHAYGDKPVCFCNKCMNYLHPSCAGVLGTSTVLIDGREQVLLPATESLPQSCPKCLGINQISQLSLQQSNSTDLAPSSSSLNRSMTSISRIASTSISNPQISNLSIAITAGFKFRCGTCQKLGEGLFCLCNQCKQYLHPSCAGVETGAVYTADGVKQTVLPAQENLPGSCRNCLTEMTNGSMIMTNQLYVQQRSLVASSSGSSLTSFYEMGSRSAHEIKEGEGSLMVHMHIPGHQLMPKNDSTNYNCSGCKIEGFGFHYQCENSSCSFRLHRECMSPRKNTTHSFFPKSTFVFSGSSQSTTCKKKHGKEVQTNKFCNACGLAVNGYFYHSFDGKINLHPCCINLPEKISCGDTHAQMVLQPENRSKCGYCHGKNSKLSNGGFNNHIWSYVAVGGSENVSLHIGCLINMLTEKTKRDSMGVLISCEMTCEKNGLGKMKLVLQNAKMKYEDKFKSIVKYARIALGAIIAAVLGDPTTLIVSTVVAVASN